MNVQGCNILFQDHQVVCQPAESWSQEFVDQMVADMAETLSPNGSAREHAQELRQMNNDGTWAIKKL